MLRTPRKRAFVAALAGAIVLGAGAVTVPVAFAEETGSITGHLTDGGSPVSNAFVDVYDTAFGWHGSATTDETGAFEFPALAAGDYKLQFYVDGLVQWSVQKTSFDTADLIAVSVGQATTVEEELLPRGTITGHLTDNGAPVSGALVYVYDTTFAFIASVGVDDLGAFTLQVPPGEYKIEFMIDDLVQWSAQKTSFDAADVITVTAGQTTTVEEQLLPRGTITGHFTSSGSPVVGASVGVYDTNFTFARGTSTDETGGFTVQVPAGEYKILFNLDGFTQWSAQKASFEEADIITVTAGQTTTVEEQLPALGTIAGRITNADGSPVTHGMITAQLLDPPHTSAFATTDENGDYQILTPPGEYQVQFSKDFNSPTQWANNAKTSEDAARIQVVGGEVTALDQQLLPMGTISGVVTTADGTPVPFASVIATEVGAVEGAYELTDSNGAYQLTVFSGEYTLEFGTQFGTQWATGRPTAALADHITIGASDQVTHNETLAELGTLMITAVNSVTSEAVLGFCVDVGGGGDCTDSGTVSVDLLPGRYHLIYTSTDDRYLSGTMMVDVTSGATTPVALPFTPAASVTTTVIDRQTGAPVANACVELVGVTSAYSLGNRFNCTDETGTVTLNYMAAGQYKTFIWAHDGVHGHQWVGWGGGVGQFGKARTVTLAAGQSVTLPTIRLDRVGGDITGTVTDDATGAPIDRANVWLSSFSSGIGGPGGFPTDEQGRYTVTGLGPYKWELFFSAPSYASEWSGNAGARAKAKTVRVKPHATVTYNTSLGRGTAVSGIITDPSGTLAEHGRITFHDAVTGDEIAVGDIFDTQVPGQYTAQLKGPQRVKVAYHVMVGGQWYRGWVGGDTFAAATKVFIPASGTLTLDITAVQPEL